MYIHALRYTVAVPVCEQGLFGIFFLGSHDCEKIFPIIRCHSEIFFHVKKFADYNSVLIFYFSVLLQEVAFSPHVIQIITSVFKRPTTVHYHEKERFSWRKLVDDCFPIRAKGFTFMTVFPTTIWDIGLKGSLHVYLWSTMAFPKPTCKTKSLSWVNFQRQKRFLGQRGTPHFLRSTLDRKRYSVRTQRLCTSFC